MDLIKLESHLPLKAYPKETLQKIIYEEFIFWLSDLLSLKDEVSAKRLYNALPALEVQCWSMGFQEIKKMFEMYADNKLSIQPIPNYFDRILFGKIVKSYKDQKKVIPKKLEIQMISEESKEEIVLSGLEKSFRLYKETGVIEFGRLYLYEFLYEKDLLPKDKSTKDAVMRMAKDNFETQSKNVLTREDKTLFKLLDNKGKHTNALINECKVITIKRFYDKFTTVKQIIKLM